MTEDLNSRLTYSCRRCGETYTTAEYQNTHFCTYCGTLLKRTSNTATSKPQRKERDKSDFQSTVREFFPYEDFRPYQLNAIKFAFDTIKNRKIGLLSSPCGTGKSISVLTAFLMAKEADNSTGRLLALTRTKNQLEIYCRELKSIKDRCGVSLVASVFKSKKELCPQIAEDPRARNLSYRDFLYYCKGLKEATFGKTCRYYDRTCSEGKPSWVTYDAVDRIKKVGPLMPEEVYEICRDKQICPYEVTKILTRYADIIIGNYNYILVDAIRGSVLGKAGLQTRNMNCVFDEAHSLPYYAAGLSSDELSSTSVRRASREIRAFGLDDSGFLQALYDTMVTLGKDTYTKYGLNVEHIVKAEDLTGPLEKTVDVGAQGLRAFITELAYLGESIREKRAETGRNPVSYLSRCAGFLVDWLRLSGPAYVRYVKTETDREGRKHVRVGTRCLDPALAASVVNELRSAILMSGTLWHPEYYVDVLGIERQRCETMELPNPFPPENRLLLVDKAVSTKFENRNQELWKTIAQHLTQVISRIDGRVAVYFPSYEVMRSVNAKAKLGYPMVIEEKNTRIVDVLRFLKENAACVVFGVARGKISEGVDMSTEGRSMLSSVVIVGLPYPKKTELQLALYEYFREKFGDRAMEYSNDIPCLNALAQSTGRLLRSPEDKGIIVVMDERAAGRFKNRLPREWREEMKASAGIEEILQSIDGFYNASQSHDES